ncbi:MAG TPA: HEAT repeat domain-containing protein [Gemmataceae bacterium]|nr:HEAT repeat domain-containing protein [Gemmataceae bacterium]
MPPRHLILLPAALLLFTAAAPLRADDNDPLAGEAKTLQAAGLPTDAKALLDFFKKRTANDAAAEKIAEQVKLLADKKADVHKKAMGELVSVGAPAIPLLRQAARDPDDVAAADRARKCLEQIEGSSGASVVAAAVRVVAAGRPAGAAETLLAYLPFADDDAVADEIKTALAAVALRDGKPDPALVKALEDPASLKRAAAVEALCQPGADQALPAVRKLLKDPKPAVRLRAALALADHRDPAAVETLVQLLGELPNVQGKQAEEYLLQLAAEQAPKARLGNDEASRKRCHDAWAAWWKATEGQAPLKEFQKRTLTDETREKAMELIKKMGDENFATRQKAQDDLEAMGASVLPLLRQASSDKDPEISSRSRKVLENLSKANVTGLSPVAVRLVALRKPEGAAGVLLAYLPTADDESIAAEVQAALNLVALRDGKPDPAVLKALEDKSPVRRAAAAEALAQSFAHRDTARKLLKDKDPSVRVKVALALANAQDLAAVPVLIDQLAELPPDQASQAEAFLRELAGEKGPKESLGKGDAERKKCRDAWAAWWKANAEKVVLARPAHVERQLGYTLIVQINNNRICEIDKDGKERWAMNGVAYPWDARMLPGDRILVAEFSGQRVTERNLKGEVLWQHAAQNPIAAQRLPNGHTFIVQRNRIFEVDRAGKEVFSMNRNQYDLVAAMKGRDGQIVYCTNNGTVVRLDSAGKELKSFNIGQAPHTGGIDLLPNGRLLVPMQQFGKVAEFDREGKQVWEASTMPYPSSAVRLPNGHTLVSSQNQNKVQEINRSGKVVWEQQVNTGQVWKARRR